MRKLLALLMACVLMSSIVWVAVAQESKVLTIDIISYAENDPTDERFNASLEELTGYRVEINWIPTIGYADKINTLIAADGLSRITIITSNRSSAFVNACRTGMFWQIDDYMDKFENFSKIADSVYNNVRIDGGLYGIPRERALVRQGIIYRKDWADEAGLGQPASIDDIITMVETFAARDGVKYGLTSGYQQSDYLPEGLLYTAIMYGAPNTYGLDTEGNFTSMYTTQEYFEAVKLWRSWYESGLLNKDYLEVNQDDGKRIALCNGETGFVFGYCENGDGDYSELYINEPDAELWYAYCFKNEATGEPVAIGTSGFNGLIAFSKTANPEEADLLECLDFINNTQSAEVGTLFDWGIEGITYTVDENGFGYRTDEQSDEYSNMGYYGQLNSQLISNASSIINVNQSEFATGYKEEQIKWASVAKGSLATGLDSPTNTVIGSTELTPILSETISMYITGQIGDDEYWAGIQAYLDAGGQQVIDEYYEGWLANQ